MSIIPAITHRPAAISSPRVARLKAVGLALAGTLAVWSVATLGLDIDLHAPAFEPGAENPRIGAGTVAFATLAGGLAGWALLALAERLLGRRGRRVWAAAAVLALLMSFGGPFAGTGVTDENRLILASMHVVAGAILIPLLYRSSRDELEG